LSCVHKMMLLKKMAFLWTFLVSMCQAIGYKDSSDETCGNLKRLSPQRPG